MALDLIKQYLVGIGFNVDTNSLKTAQESMSQAEESIKKFNEESNKGFSETSGSLKDLFNLFSSSPTLLKAIALHSPFRSLIKDIYLLKKIYKEISGFKPKENKDKVSRTKNKDRSEYINKFKYPKFESSKDIIKVPNNPIDKLDTKGAKKEILDFTSNANKGLLDVANIAQELLSKGGGAIKAFATTSAGAFALIGVTVVGVIAGIKKLVSSLKELANDDIKFEKLSRQLWTTKENAREISTALDTLDASMEDLWLSPTLLKQFKQLTGDLKNMKLPADFNRNIKVVQGLGLEFKRTKQMVVQFFKLIGSYILKYIAGPLDEVRNKIHGTNDWLVQNLPKIAKVIGTIIGVLLRIIMIIGKILAIIWKLTAPIVYIFKLIGKLGNAFSKMPEPVKKAVKIITAVLMTILSPILLIIGLIDDIVTYFRGGKSVIGSFIDKIVNKSTKAGKVISLIVKTIKAILTGGLSLITWDKYWKKAKETFEKIKNKAKETWDKVKEWSEGKIEKVKDFANGLKEKVQSFGESIVNNTAANYVTSNTNKISNNTTTSNSHNTTSNTINVYASRDAKGAVNAINNVLTGISTRNTQGVVN